jgi:hypothetical protein
MISVNRLYFRSHYFYGVKIRSSIRFIFIFTCVVMCCSRSEPCCVLRCGECGHRPRFVCLLDFSFRFLDASIDCLLSLEFCLRWILRPFLSLTSSERFFVLASLPLDLLRGFRCRACFEVSARSADLGQGQFSRCAIFVCSSVFRVRRWPDLLFPLKPLCPRPRICVSRSRGQAVWHFSRCSGFSRWDSSLMIYFGSGLWSPLVFVFRGWSSSCRRFFSS